MTPANQHTGIERLSDERLREKLARRIRMRDAFMLNSYNYSVEAEIVSALTELLSLRASAEQQEPGFPDFYAVQSKTGMHIGLWRELDLAHKAASDPDYAGSTIIPLYTHPHSSSAVDGVTEVMWSVLDQYDAETKSIALGHENVSLGRSTYNWRRTVSGEIRAALAAALAGGSNGRE